MKRTIVILLTAAAAALAGGLDVGCSSSGSDEQLLRELANLDKQSIFDRGEGLYQQEKWADARRYFSFVYDTFPNDPLGHRAALRIADTYAAKSDSVSQTEARLRYRDFANRYPNDPDRDYALLMLGRTHTPKKLRSDRDLAPVKDALDAYQQLLNLYPGSQHNDAAREEMAALRWTLADHEWLTARFYARNKNWVGVQWRLEYLKENYPEYPEMDQVDELLGRATKIVEERQERIEELKAELEARKSAEESAGSDSD
jgi:outer membrane protein assembly factor BamD